MIDNFSGLVGETLLRVEQRHDNEVWFEVASGGAYRLRHSQDCCESVWLVDVVGDFADLVGSPVMLADESSHDGSNEDGVYGSRTWTFYRLGTARGYVDLRWCGESNGYYSESVDFEQVDSADDDWPAQVDTALMAS